MEIVADNRILVSLVYTTVKRKRVFLAADMIRLIAHYLSYKEMVNLITIKKSVYNELKKTYGGNLYNVSRIYEFSFDDKTCHANSEHYPKNAIIHIDAIRTVILKSAKLIHNMSTWRNLNSYSILQNLVLENCITSFHIDIPVLRVTIINAWLTWGRKFASALQYINTDSNLQSVYGYYPKLETIKVRGASFDIDFNKLPIIKHLNVEVYNADEINIYNLDKLDHDMNYIRIISDEEHHTNIYLLKNGELIYSDGDCRKYRNVKINGYNINIVCISN